MNQEYELSIITINYNGLEDTCQMLSSLSLGDISAQVIVVDNGSSEKSKNQIFFRQNSISTKDILYFPHRKTFNIRDTT